MTRSRFAGHHPGPPRFIHADERLVDPIFVDSQHGLDRDNLAPTVDGAPERDPEPHAPSAFSWSIVDQPEGSETGVEYAPTPYDDAAQYDHGDHHTAELQPDAPGTYVLELGAPDGTHRQTVRVLPAAPDDAGGPPRLELDGRYDAAAGEFVLTADAEVSPTSDADPEALTAEWLPSDACGLDPEDIDIDGLTARVPIGAVDGEARLFAAPYDGQVLGTTDEVVLDAERERVDLPNRPPEWLDDAVVYEIFTRSFAGVPGETDFGFLTRKVDYLAELGIDVVWLTPIVPAWSAGVDDPPGGPHAYSTEDYFDVAPDLGTLADFEAFVDACHEREIRVCFDLVVNHCGWTNDRFQDTVAETGPEPDETGSFPDVEAWDYESTYFDWFDRRAGATDTDAAPAATYFFGTRLQPNLNYGNVALREHVLAAAEFWAPRVDAFRCDIAWGVPHSFWKELRRRVRDIDEEFMLLDETIPRLPAFAASEFDAHFDTTGFMHAAHGVARGDRPATALLDAVEQRRIDGFPTYTRLLNTTENHDERRLYHEAKTEGHREDPAAAQRAAMAAGFTLPGVPFVLYGQERLIGEHGTPRESAYADDPARTDDDIVDDPYKRAFMNWETYPPEHLQFYRDLIDCYHELDVLGPSADLVEAPHCGADEDVLVFGRESEAQSVVVVVNFDDEPEQVELRNAVDPCNLFTGADCEVDGPDHVTRVEVDTLGVFETPGVLGEGHRP